jgi:hypothetical protein
MLLDRYGATSPSHDLRRWEWYYLSTLLREKATNFGVSFRAPPWRITVAENGRRLAVAHGNGGMVTVIDVVNSHMYMSLIYTCYLSGVSPMDYLTELQRNHQRVRARPVDWMPWNYRQQLVAAESTPTKSARAHRESAWLGPRRVPKVSGHFDDLHSNGELAARRTGVCTTGVNPSRLPVVVRVRR